MIGGEGDGDSEEFLFGDVGGEEFAGTLVLNGRVLYGYDDLNEIASEVNAAFVEGNGMARGSRNADKVLSSLLASRANLGTSDHTAAFEVKAANRVPYPEKAHKFETPQEIYLRLLAPGAPHIAEELWTVHLGRPYSIHQQSWPQVDEAAAKDDNIEIPVQVNGRVRDRVVVPAEAGEEEIKATALASEQVQKYLQGREPRKVIVANKRTGQCGRVNPDLRMYAQQVCDTVCSIAVTSRATDRNL